MATVTRTDSTGSSSEFLSALQTTPRASARLWSAGSFVIMWNWFVRSLLRHDPCSQTESLPYSPSAR